MANLQWRFMSVVSFLFLLPLLILYHRSVYSASLADKNEHSGLHSMKFYSGNIATVTEHYHFLGLKPTVIKGKPQFAANGDASLSVPASRTGKLPSFATETDRTVDCSKVFAGNQTEIAKWNETSFHLPTDHETEKLFTNCTRFLKKFSYATSAGSQDEKNFPIAFSISMHKDVVQLERLLRLIYRPHNSYCIHVDQKSLKTTHDAVNALIECFPNVFRTQSVDVFWGDYGVLKAVLNCARDLLVFNQNWRYMINIGAQDFPLKTNYELVKILTILNGSNDVELQPELKFSRYWYQHKLMPTANKSIFEMIPDFKSTKLPVPHRIRVLKGNLAATLSRKFVEYLMTDQRSVEFADWLNGTDTADEHLWSSINHSPILSPPGGYPAKCLDKNHTKGYISRYVKWRSSGNCAGKYVHDVCVMGLGDLPDLINRSELFANKFYMDYQSHAFECMNHWYMQKSRKRGKIDENFYRQLDAVRFQNIGKCQQTKNSVDNLKFGNIISGQVENVRL